MSDRKAYQYITLELYGRHDGVGGIGDKLCSLGQDGWRLNTVLGGFLFLLEREVIRGQVLLPSEIKLIRAIYEKQHNSEEKEDEKANGR